MELHEILSSISCEIVGQNFARGIISEAHVLGNDGISFYSAVCGRRNSFQEGFFDTLSSRAEIPLCCYFSPKYWYSDRKSKSCFSNEE